MNTKLPAEKKKARRPSTGAGVHGEDHKDSYQLFAENVREHKDLESRWAILEEEETRVEYFRGKDFVKFLTNHPEVKQVLESDKHLEAIDVGNNLLRKGLILRCDRVVKTPRPGKKKLSSWPAHLETFHAQVFSDNGGFYAWTFEKKNPMWQTLLTFLWPFLTLGICLFPVYPYWCKRLVMYLCAGILVISLSMLLVRACIFGIVWVICGKRVWFFPNILADEALGKLFQFWPDEDKEERFRPKWSTRLFYGTVAVVVVLLLRHHSPDEDARTRYQKRMSNIIDDVLEWSPTLSLSG